MYISFLNIDTEKKDQWTPERIGMDVRTCPQCERPLSYTDRIGLYCRSCHVAVRQRIQRYKEVVKNGR